MKDRLNKIDMGLLVAFEALALERNVSRAAKRLGITQPALSSRLVRLRTVFGDQLFVPVSGRGVTPTPLAEKLGAELPALLDHLRAFVGRTPDFDPEASQRIFVVAAYDNPAAILAPDLVASMKRVAPGVRIALLLPDVRRLGESLERGEVDMVVGVPGMAEEGLISRSIVRDRFLTAQRRGHPRGARPLMLDEFCALEHVLISSEGGGFTGEVDEILAEQGRERRVGVSIQNYALAPVILSNTDYLCTLPGRFLMQFRSMLDFLEPPLDLGHFELHALWHPRMKDDPAHRWFRSQVFDAARCARKDRTPWRACEGAAK